MAPDISVQNIVDERARDPLRNVVLLKHLQAYPAHSTVHRVSDATGAGTLVVVDASVTSYDRQTYPRAAFAVLISSDHPGCGLTPRYQVEADNKASIALAQSVGLTPFLTIVHYAHEC